MAVSQGRLEAMNGKTEAIRHVVGVMTGTSIDGIDAAMVRIRGVKLAMRADLVVRNGCGLGNIGTRLRHAAEQKPMTAGELATLARDLGCLHAQTIAELLEGQSVGPNLICVHGQTVFHQPPVSCQLINPEPIAQQFGCPVVFDLRQADLAAGGQGAPITPIADWVLFRDEKKRRAVINLGGFCNVTVLPASGAVVEPGLGELEGIAGFDVCACNQILDLIARDGLKKPFDDNGAAAQGGKVNASAAAALLELLNRQRVSRRSLGTGDEVSNWVHASLKAGVAAGDLAATAVDAIAGCIAAAIDSHRVDEIILAGGGARHLALKKAIGDAATTTVRISDELAVPLEARESMAFAVLGALCADGVAITLPQVTGCSRPAPVAGTWVRPHSV